MSWCLCVCMYMCMCMHACVYDCMYANMTCMHSLECAWGHMYACVHCVCVCVCVQNDVCMICECHAISVVGVYRSVREYVYMYVCMCVSVYAHM